MSNFEDMSDSDYDADSESEHRVLSAFGRLCLVSKDKNTPRSREDTPRLGESNTTDHPSKTSITPTKTTPARRSSKGNKLQQVREEGGSNGAPEALREGLGIKATDPMEEDQESDGCLTAETGALRLFNLMPPPRKRVASETDRNKLPKRSRPSDDSRECSVEPPVKRREKSETDSSPLSKRARVSDVSREGSEEPPSRKQEASETDRNALPKRLRV
ncbi:hypothetical protein ACEPPN_015103 [Leptodophora sp. 'Broadleaf-Isolate-01']